MGAALSALSVCSMAATGLSCCSSITGACCCAARSGSAEITPRAAKGGYFGLLAVSAILGGIALHYGDQIGYLADIPALKDACGALPGPAASTCYATSVVLRLSLACGLFFSLFAVVGTLSSTVFRGWWGLKVLLWFAAVAGCFFVPDADINNFAKYAVACSSIFLFAMAVMLVDACYTAQAWISAKMDAIDAVLSTHYDSIGLCQNKWRLAYLAATLLAFVGAFVGIGYLYKFSVNQPGTTCSSNVGFLSVTLVTAVIYTVLSAVECLSPQGSRGVLMPSLMFAYCTWLVWSAIEHNPDAACNPVASTQDSTAASIVGIVVAALSLCWTAFSAERSLPKLLSSGVGSAGSRTSGDDADASEYTSLRKSSAGGGGGGSGRGGSGADAADEEAGAGKSAAEYRDADGSHASDDNKPLASNAAAAAADTPAQRFLYLFILVVASAYMAMVLTNWATSTENAMDTRASAGNMWVQIGAQWAAVLLFSWTLVAPALCPGRDFS
jgi:hypothetical protein